MICSHCGRAFSETHGQMACHGCGQFGGCHLIKCPYCGYEQPQVPAWVGKLQELLARAGLKARVRDTETEV